MLHDVLIFDYLSDNPHGQVFPQCLAEGMSRPRTCFPCRRDTEITENITLVHYSLTSWSNQLFHYSVIRFTEETCSGGMIYRECGSICEESTCSNRHKLDRDCIGNCVDGCECPRGKKVIKYYKA